MPSLDVSFLLTIALVAVRLYGAFNGILSDCDEVYNYWEPLNFLTRFFGKKTWEYQPEYAIRSWTYLLPYALLKYPLSWIQKSLEISGALSKGAIPAYTFFYLTRVALALSFTFAECCLADALTYISSELSSWFLLYQIISPGVFQASISLLPSSFALLFGMLSTASIVKYFRFDLFSHKIERDFISGSKVIEDSTEPSIPDTTNEATPSKASPSQGLSSPQMFLCAMYKGSLSRRDKFFALAVGSAAIGGLIGWPFALVLTATFVVYVTISLLIVKKLPEPLAAVNRRKWSIFIYFLAGLSCTYMVGWIGCLIDGLFYLKSTLVPLNIVLYNVLRTTKETGPSIFGVEPTGYYLLNLFLNFHVIFLMVLVDMPGIGSSDFKMGFWQGLAAYRAPLYIWFAIFFSQPHKEERFMYPVYHLITISAAVFTCKFIRIFGTPDKRRFFYHLARLAFFSVTVVLGVLRIISVIQNYGAPLSAFKALAAQPPVHPDNSTILENVCIGREWYHYPSSFFLQSNQRLRYVENGFRGMLPGDFVEPSIHSLDGLRNSTYLDQEGFNNKNEYNPDFVYPNLDSCDYYIDINMPVDSESGEISIFEKDGSSSNGNWQTIRCENMIDPDRSYGLAKLIYLPTTEIQYFKSFLTNLLKNKYVVAIKGNLLYQKLTDRETYKFLLDSKPVKKLSEPETYKPLFENEQVQKLYTESMARVFEVDSKYQLAAKVPGKVFYHKFCVARRI